MKRKDAITCIMYAGYHEDTAAGMRLYIENRVSYATYKKAFNEGRRRKEAGMRCNCRQCAGQQEEKS